MAKLKSLSGNTEKIEKEINAAQIERMCRFLKSWRIQTAHLSIEEGRHYLTFVILPEFETQEFVAGLALAKIAKYDGAILYVEAVDEVVEEMNYRGELECVYYFQELEHYMAQGLRLMGGVVPVPVQLPDRVRNRKPIKVENVQRGKFRWVFGKQKGGAS
jgi:hypothetical protein